MDKKKLYLLAKEVKKNAYAPYSGFHVGAALVTEDGTVYTGVNVEIDSYGATICAERTAAVKAVSEGHRKFKKIAVCGGEGKATPCGICREFLSEFSLDMDVITGDDEQHLETKKLAELLPDDFELREK